MKIIFLDIDGVLNSHSYDTQRGQNDGNIDVTRVELLGKLVEKTGAKIVLTSTWRLYWSPCKEKCSESGLEMQELFNSYGIELFDKTPFLKSGRAEEISAWLEKRSDIEKYVIIDDIKIGWGGLDPFVVKTDYRIGRGLMDKHVELALNILCGES